MFFNLHYRNRYRRSSILFQQCWEWSSLYYLFYLWVGQNRGSNLAGTGSTHIYQGRRFGRGYNFPVSLISEMYQELYDIKCLKKIFQNSFFNFRDVSRVVWYKMFWEKCFRIRKKATKNVISIPHNFFPTLVIIYIFYLKKSQLK